MNRILAAALAALLLTPAGCGTANLATGGGYVLRGAKPAGPQPRHPPPAARDGLTSPSGDLGTRIARPSAPAPSPAPLASPGAVLPSPRPPVQAAVQAPVQAPVHYPPPAAGIGSPPPSALGTTGIGGTPTPVASPLFAPITPTPQLTPRPLAASRPLGEKEMALDTDADSRVDTWIKVSEGVITRVSRDTDRDGKPDFTSNFSRVAGLPLSEVQYKGDTGQVALKTEFEEGVKTKREADENGDGNPDHWWYYLGGELSKEAWDKDGDGKIDIVKRYRNQKVLRVEYDEDRDGTFEKSDLLQDGVRVRTRIEDSDGILELVYDGGGQRVVRKERDTDGSGRPNIVVVLDPASGARVREDRDLNGDGRPDVSAYFEGGKLVRREISGAYLRAQKAPDRQAPSVDVEKRDFRKLTGS